MSAMADERLTEIRALDTAALPGPWRWHGNTDYPDSICIENREWVVVAANARVRTAEDVEFKRYVDYLLETDTGELYTDHDDDGNDWADEASREAGALARATEQARTEMLTGAWGEPAEDRRLYFGPAPDREAPRGFAQDLAVYQVARNQGLPDDTPADHSKVYRRDLVDLRSPNARMLTDGRQALTELLAEVDRLRRWKAEAMQVLEGWEVVYDALGRPGGLGESKPAAALLAIAAGPD